MLKFLPPSKYIYVIPIRTAYGIIMGNPRTVMTASAVPELIGLYKYQLKMCNLEPGEICLAVTDMAYNPVYADACLGAASVLGAEILKLTLPFNGPLPKKAWGAAMEDADLVLYSTTHTLHYTEEVRRALARGARVLAVMKPLHAMERTKADPVVINRTIAGGRYLEKASTIRITSDAGTDITMERGNRPAVVHYGVADVPGHLDGWGAGLVETAPIEGSVEGTMVLDIGDQMFYLARYVDRPIKVTFREGRVVDIRGAGVDAFLLRKHLESFNEESAWMAGHFAMGTDHRALWAAQALQFPEPGTSPGDAETFAGNVQIELGSNDDVSFQGKNRSTAHLGHCMLNCSLYFDDTMILDHGKFVQPDMQ
jgi:2,5-dihydroxypyridine 5,6-dioxygenase